MQAPLTEAPEGVDLVLYRLKAQTHILQTAEFKPEWEGAQLGKYYLWYNPVTGEAPAYVEFQVLKEGDPAGYIMLSLTELDFDIPEYHTEGKTVYELLEEKADSSTIRAVRFNAFGYMAEVQVRSEISRRVFFGALDYLNEEKSRGNGKENGGYEEYLKEYLAKRRELGAIGGSKTELEGYYETLAQQEAASTRGNPQPPYPGLSQTRISHLELLPKYEQYKKAGKFEHSGCTPTAGAMVLGYWYLRHGKTRLFPGKPVTYWDGQRATEKQVIESLGGYMKTTYSKSGGGTFPYDAWSGIVGYLGSKTYPAWVTRWYWVDYNSDEGRSFEVSMTNDWNAIYKEIEANRPAILHYNDTEVSKKAYHSAVIYGLQVYKDRWTGKVVNTHCDIYTGWKGETEKNVNARSWELNEVLTIHIW